jgi:hypothetical protein
VKAHRFLWTTFRCKGAYVILAWESISARCASRWVAAPSVSLGDSARFFGPSPERECVSHRSFDAAAALKLSFATLKSTLVSSCGGYS